ncbi:DUF4184 family protein [Psychrobacter sp. FBL11]|uniref:DUF4184 family protein n=1 Tax=Psychrobacter saeujeotis TaxID=3143436 RepID=A0ABU9X819_9GAMM|nr:DUF4184 family protein [uncultured Psychrobacter sp.]
MAFTLAHMAAALPFYPDKRRLHFEALLIGTMMPDLHYYLNIPRSFSRQSHEWIGIFTYNLPWGFLIFTLWYWGLKPATYALIQPFLKVSTENTLNQQGLNPGNNYYKGQKRIIGYAARYWSLRGIKKRVIHKVKSFYLPVVFGLILGATTHLVWDGITHADGSIARHIDWLQYPLYFYPFKGTSIARLLQYLSSMVGLAALFWFAWSRSKNWQINNKDVVKERLGIDNIVRLVFSKKQSAIIIALMVTLTLIWGMQAVLSWYPSLTSSPYRFAAGVSVSLLKRVTLLCVSYAALYHLTYFVQRTYRQYKNNKVG